MVKKARRVVFIFSHPMLLNVWTRARELAKEDSIEIVVIQQGAVVDWERIGADVIGSADAVYFSGSRHFSNFAALASACRKAPYALPSGIEAAGAFDVHDEQAADRVDAYFTAGSAEDLANAARFLLYKSGNIPTLPAEPTQPLWCGVWHPHADVLFSSLGEYLAWIDQRDPAAHELPLVPFCFPRTWLLSEDMALAHALIDPLRKEGMLAVPIFCDSDLASSFGKKLPHPLDALFVDCGRRLASIWNALSSHASDGERAGDPFAAYGVPLFQIIRNYNQTTEEWRASDEGLSAMSICYSLTKPEMLGCIEPTLLACNETIERDSLSGKTHTSVPVPERIEHLAARTARWHALRTKANSEKRVAIMLHNAPCKGVEATVASAAGLNAAESAVAIMNRLKDEGYRVEGIPADGRELLDLIFAKKALSEFRWTNVEEIVGKGGAIARIDRQEYLRDFARLSQAVQKRIIDSWDPFPGEAMVYGKETDSPRLIVTGVRFGNILVMVEPKRGCWGPKCDGEVCRILHEPDIPPPHHWLASYWFLQREVDALISLGAESPLEYLPGKRAALSGDCFPEISLGALPLIYPYILSATGEGLIAKRRGRGVLIDHLTPPIARVVDEWGHWAEMETLHAQYCAARDVKDGGRLARIAAQLQELMVRGALLDPEASHETFELRVEQLPRRIEQLKKRFTEKRSHILGRIPEPEAANCYLAEARGNQNREIDEPLMRRNLQRTTDELDRVVSTLSACFVPPGPSGHLSRGKIDALPTGRNFYGTDLKAIPTRAAWETGVEMGRMILLKYLDEEGSFPGSIAITLWSSDVFRADGELISQGLWLAGCRPVWTAGGRVTGVETIPRAELTMEDGRGASILRPRIDIVIQMSGIVRDTLPNMYMMLDEAVGKAAALDEPEDVNYIRAHVEERLRELRAGMPGAQLSALHRLARCRVFSSKPGSYGTGVSLAVDAAAWETDADLAEAYINWTGFAYGKGLEGRPPIAGDAAATLREYSRLMGSIAIAYQKAIGPEYDAISTGCYSGFQGGMAAVNRAVGAGDARMYWGDSSSGVKPEVRTLGEEIDQALFARLLNPDWLAEKKRDGAVGAHNVSCMINTLFHWSATARVVNDEQFDAVWGAYINNDENRQWLHSENIYALEEITRRLLEAASRTMWNAGEEKIEKLQQIMLSIEGDIEDRMGTVEGEYQGGAVDIKKRKDVAKWRYAYTLDDQISR